MNLFDKIKEFFLNSIKQPDKVFHGWLHTMLVRGLITHGLNIPIIKNFHPDKWYYALLISFVFGILYEIGDLVWHCIIKKDLSFITYVKDSIKDIIWNTIGGLFGCII